MRICVISIRHWDRTRCAIPAAFIRDTRRNLRDSGNYPYPFPARRASLTSLCFFTALGSPGGYAVAVCVVLFAFSTIIAWYYMGRQAAEYLGGKISGKIPAVYTVGYLLAAFFGCLGAMETVWEVSDIFNGLMAVPNLAALVLLAGEIYAPGEKRDP